MNHIAWFLGIFIVGEVLAFIAFMAIRGKVANSAIFKRPDVETFKGVLERLVLYSGLTAGFPTVLVMFGALKLGTRLHDEGDRNVSNNYFLIGNLFSALVAIADAAAWSLMRS